MMQSYPNNSPQAAARIVALAMLAEGDLSIAAQLGGAGNWIPYAAAKGALNSFTVGLAREVAAEGIRVNALMPGLIDTEIHAEAGVADRLNKVIAMVPMGRIGTPGECAEAIAWPLSGEAAYMTGAVLPMTGGR